MIFFTSRFELEEEEESQSFCQRLTRLLGDLIYVGSKELHIKANVIVEVFQLPGFKMNIPTAKGKPLIGYRFYLSISYWFVY